MNLSRAKIGNSKDDSDSDHELTTFIRFENNIKSFFKSEHEITKPKLILKHIRLFQNLEVWKKIDYQSAEKLCWRELFFVSCVSINWNGTYRLMKSLTCSKTIFSLQSEIPFRHRFISFTFWTRAVAILTGSDFLPLYAST